MAKRVAVLALLGLAVFAGAAQASGSQLRYGPVKHYVDLLAQDVCKETDCAEFTDACRRRAARRINCIIGLWDQPKEEHVIACYQQFSFYLRRGKLLEHAAKPHCKVEAAPEP